MTAWKTYIQFAALRSRAVLAQREPAPTATAQEETDCENDIPTELDTRPHLLIHSADGSIYYWLTQSENWRIGRSSECDIAIADQWMSRFHAAMQFVAPDEFYLVDLQSYNGSFINERRVRDIAKLENGDRIRLGKTEIDFYGGRRNAKNWATMATRALQSSTPMAR